MADIAELGFRLDTRDLTRGKGALDELSKSAEKAQQKSDGLGNALEKTKGSTSGAAKAAEEAAKSHDRLGSAAERAKESTGALGEASKRTASSIGAIAVALGATVAAATDANRVLREFSREMAALGAVLGGTSEQMVQLREQAKVMGATTKFGAQQAAEAQKNLAQAGLSVQQIMTATPKVLNLATAGNLELAQSAEFLVDVMSQANLTVADFGRISDVAVKAANLSTTSVAQLSQGYKYAMANGALLGMSIEEVTSALAVLAQAGLKAEQGGTGLRGIASRFMQPSKEMTKTLKENSISVNDLNIAARGLAPVLDTIAKSTLSIPELMELFGQEASSAGLALVKNRQQFVDWANELKNVNGVTQQVAKDMSDQLDDAFRSVRSAVEGAYIAISDATGYEKGLQNALNFSSGIINHFSGMNRSAVEAGLMTKQMAADFESSGNAITATLKAFAAVGAGAAMLAVPSIIAGIGSAATAAAGGVTALTAAIVANPIGLAVAGITAATAALYLFRDETVTVGDTTANVSDFIAATWDETAGQLIDAVTPFFDNFSISLSAITGLAESDSQKIAAFFEGAADVIGAAIKGAINGALNAFPALVAGAAAAAKAVGDSFQAIMRADFSGAIAAITGGAKSTIDAYTSRLTQDTIGKAVSGTFDRIADNAKKRSEQTQAEAKRMAQSASYASAEIERLTARSKPMIAKVQPFSPVASKPDTGDDKKKKDKEAAKAAKELASEQAKLNDLLQRGEGFSTTYAEKLALLGKYQSKIPVDEYRAAVEKLILTETEAGKTAAKHAEEVAKLQDTFREEDAKRAANLQIQNEELKFQSSLLGKTALEQAALTAQWEEEKKIREEIIELTTKQTQAEQDGNQWAVTAIQDRINMLESEAVARKEAAAGIAMQKEIQQQWGNISADIERALTDSIERGMEDGKGFFDSFRHYVMNLGKTLAVRLLVQPVMGAVNAIGAPLFGAMSGVSQAGGASGFGGVSNLISGLTGNSYGAGFGNLAADGIGLLGGGTNNIATSFLGNVATNAPMIPNWQFGLAGIGGGLAGNFIGKSIFGDKGYAGSGGSLGGSLGSSLALAAGAGPLGIAAGLLGGSLLGGGLGSLFGDKKPDERKARFGYGASDALREEGLRTGWTGSSVFGQFRTYADKWFSGSEMGAAMGQFIDSLESLDNAVADSLKLTGDQTQSAIEALKSIDKEYSFGMQWEDFTANSKAREQIAVDRYATIFDSVEAGWGDFVRQFQGSFDQFPTYLQGVIAAMSLFREESGELVDVFGKRIEGISAFAEFAKTGENNADAFKRLYSVFQATNAVLESLGKSAKGTGLETTALRESFIKLAGGMESLAGYVQEYNDGFFTAAEKEAKVREQLQREFDKYNATLPTTRLEWRKLMESLDLSTQAGQEAAAKLYQLQGAFLSITPEIESATEAAKDFKDEIADLEQYFRDQLIAVDYSGMTEQGRQAASTLDELTSKLTRLSEIGGDVDLGVQAIGRYIKTEIPKLYADALAPFKQAGGRGYTDLGKNIFGLFGAAQEANKGIAEISSQEQSAIIKASTITKVIAKDAPIAIEDSIAAIKKIDFASMADPAGELAKQAFGRDATAQERAAIDEAYQWGIANGKSLDAIVSDIVDHALRFDEALQFLGAKTKTQYEDIKIVDTEQSAAMQANAAIKKANATAELVAGFIGAVYSEFESAFADVNKEASFIGLSEVGRAAKEAADTLAERMRSIVETVQLTAAGIAKTGGIDATSKAKELADAYSKGAIKTGEELKTAVDAAFDGVAGSDDLKKAILLAAESSKKLFDETAKQLREQLVAPWQSAFDALTGNSIDAEINAAIKAKDQALADAKTLAELLGQNFDDLAKEIQRGFNAQLFGLTKQKLQGVIDSISKIADFQTGIDDAIFGLRVGMSDADVSGLYAQRQAEIKAQLDAAMQGDNLDEQIGLANKLRETITQRYAAEQQAQERMMSFARGLGDYLRQLRTSDKSTGSIYDRLTEAQKQFAEDVALSRGAGAEAEAARGRITTTSDTLLDLARQFYASGEGYQQIYNSVVGGLEGLQIDTRTEAERQLDAINAGNDSALKQIGELQALRGTFDSKLGVLQQQQATYIAEMQKLAGQLDLSQSAILQALKDLPSALSGLIARQAAPTVQTFDQSKAVSDAFSVALPSSYVDNGGYSTIKTPTGGSVGFYDPATGVSALPKLPTLPAPSSPRIVAPVDGSHKDGLSHVPFDGYIAELHKGERVLTASENRDYSADVSRIMGAGYGGQAVAPLLNEIKALRQEVAQLRQQQSSEHQDDLRQREAIAKQSMGQTKDLQTAMIRNTALNI